ncbi:MAG: hypothetical protein V5788_01425 [Shewanella sp.]
MTLDRDTRQQSILITFFEYIRSEKFEQCFHWAKNELQVKSSPAFILVEQLEEQATVTIQDLEEIKNDEILLLFCACYGYARHEVEESNRYHHAETLVRSSISALEALPSSALNKVLQKFAVIQIDICYIDRGIYTSQEWLMAEATESIDAHLVGVTELTFQFNDVECQFYAEYLVEEFNSYRHFSQGVSIIAELCEIRWGDHDLLSQKMTKLRPVFMAAVNALTDDDKYIMSTDLEALWSPLAFFSEHRTKGSGELFVERGAIGISYFAGVNHIVTRELRQSMSDIVNQAPNAHKLYLQDWGAETPQRNMLNDIWAGIAKDFEDIYSWKLPELTMVFRDKGGKDSSLNFEVELIYYPMGIFALSLKAQLDNVSASGVRHAMSLGTPFAMDQKMRWHHQDVSLLEAFAENRFIELAKIISSNFDHYEKPVSDILTFNKTENRFVSILLDRIVECVDGEYTPVTAKSLKSHFAYPVFVLQQRELRSGVDDWCLRTVTSEEFNLNQDCYNREEFVYINHHECILALLQQPNWVLEQSAEMMNVAAAINNLFHLTNKRLDEQLKLSLDQAVLTLKDKKITASELRGRVEKLTVEGECLKQFTNDAHGLLDLISAGSMMTFPDHTRMIQKVFAHMDFEKLHIRTQETLDKIQYRQEEIISETSKLYEKLRTRNNRRFTNVLSGSMALISVGALKDIFDIINRSELGIRVSGPLQVSIVTVFGLILIILLINKNKSEQ